MFKVRFDLGRQTSEVFFRKVKFWPGDPPPAFVSHTNQDYSTALRGTNSMYLILKWSLLVAESYLIEYLTPSFVFT